VPRRGCLLHLEIDLKAVLKRPGSVNCTGDAQEIERDIACGKFDIESCELIVQHFGSRPAASLTLVGSACLLWCTIFVSDPADFTVKYPIQ